VANLKRILRRFSLAAPTLEGKDWPDTRIAIQRWMEMATSILDAGGTEVLYDSHQLLEDLQGGAADERYHLTLAQHAYLAPHAGAADPHTQYALESEFKLFTIQGPLNSPTGADNYPAWEAAFAARVTHVRALAVGGSASGTTINARKNGTLTHLATDLTVFGGTWQDGGAVQNTDYAIGDSLEFQVTGLSAPRPSKLALLLRVERIV
jgi:hypothetical protein